MPLDGDMTLLLAAGVANPGLIALLILVVAVIFGYLYFRRKPPPSPEEASLQQVEVKLKRDLYPPEIRVEINRPVQMLIHRFDTEPEHVIFEIHELAIHELLPAGHTSVIAFYPEKRGKFKIVLEGGEETGLLIVE